MKSEEDDQQEPQQQVQEKQQQQEGQKDQSFKDPPVPTMHSSSPPPAALDSPPGSTLSSDQTSHSYVFSSQEVHPPKPLSFVVAISGSEGPGSEVARQVEERGGVGVGVGVGGGVSGRKLRPSLSILRRARRENMKRKALLGCRILGFVFCLISFSVLAADKNQGWALDSFYQYKEFRYCLSVNVIGFVYSGLQAYDFAHSFTAGKQLARNRLRYLLDFSLDQILAYLLLSASSSASFRVEDWEANWGRDRFPVMAKASVALSFLAFVVFALSALISGFTFFTPL